MLIQASLRKRLVISLCFLTRITYASSNHHLPQPTLTQNLRVIAATTCQIIYSNLSSHSPDPTFDEWRLIICTQVVLSSSIVTACVPQFKRLLDCLQSGMLGTDDLRRRGQTGLYGYTGRSGKNLSEAYYMLEPKDANSHRKADQKLRERGPENTRMGSGPRDFRSQGGGDEESQHSTSHIVKVSEYNSTDEHC